MPKTNKNKRSEKFTLINYIFLKVVLSIRDAFGANNFTQIYKLILHQHILQYKEENFLPYIN